MWNAIVGDLSEFLPRTGPEYDPYNLGDYGTGAAIGNSGLYKRNDESVEEFVQRVAQVARGANGEWGTRGRSFNELQNEGFFNELAPVTINGVEYQRIGEDVSQVDPSRLGEKQRAVWDRLGISKLGQRNDEYGFLIPRAAYLEASKAAEQDNLAAEDMFDNPMTLLGMMGGMAGLSTLIANGGLSLAGLGSSLPDSYWSMLAEGGGTLSDAVSAAAGTVGADTSSIWGGLYEQALQSGFGGTMAELQSVLGAAPINELAQTGMLQSLAPNFPGAQTAIGAGASGGGVSLGGVASWLKNLPVSTLVNGAGSIGSAAIGAGAAQSAADKLAKAAEESGALQKYMFDTTRGDLMPWLKQGGVALGRIGELQGISGNPNAPGYGSLMRNFSAADLTADPIYGAARDFQLDETRGILTNAASARGETDSGVLMKDLLKYGTGVLTGQGQDAYNRYNANRTLQYNMLAPTANLGQATGVQLGQVGQQAGAAIGNTITQAGNAQAAGQVGSANAITGGISTALQAYMNNDLLRRFGVLAE